MEREGAEQLRPDASAPVLGEDEGAGKGVLAIGILRTSTREAHRDGGVSFPRDQIEAIGSHELASHARLVHRIERLDAIPHVGVRRNVCAGLDGSQLDHPDRFSLPCRFA